MPLAGVTFSFQVVNAAPILTLFYNFGLCEKNEACGILKKKA